MVWKRLFGAGHTEEVKSPLPPKEPDEVDVQLDAAFEWQDEATAAMQLRGIGSFERFDLDLAIGRIVFSGGAGPELTLACQAVGTFNAAKQTWHWAWDHPSIPKNVAGCSEVVRAFGERHDLGAFTSRQIEAEEHDAWQFTALAGMLTGAVGTYRCPGDVAVFLTLYDPD